VPSGRLAVAGFTDGTLRLFDLTGIFARDKNHPALRNSASGADAGSRRTRKGKNGAACPSSAAADELFDDDASSSDGDDDEIEIDDDNDDSATPDNATATTTTTTRRRRVVDSRSNQRYGAVSCQIHARGVHTSLLMDVAVSEDGLYAFGGVQRGSVELAAVYLGDVEGYLDERLPSSSSSSSSSGRASAAAGLKYDDSDGRGDDETPGILDLIQVDRHADAKLKGFGACTRLWNGWERARSGVERPEYLLCTGKWIKVRKSISPR
jgi:hypothetical protein